MTKIMEWGNYMEYFRKKLLTVGSEVSLFNATMRTYISKKLKLIPKRGMLVVLGICVLVMSLFVGALDVTLSKIVMGDAVTWHILLYSRIPRVLAVCLSGFSLAISGLIMQKIANNRFVSPSTAVTIDGARLGILLSYIIVTNNSLLNRTLFSLFTAAVFTILFIVLVRRIQFKNTIFVPLLGIVIGLIIDSFTNYLAMRLDLLQVLSSYTTGSFSSVLKGKYEILYFVIPLTVLSLHYSYRFNIIAMGTDFAHNIGLNTQRITIIGLLIVSALSASVMVTVGTIPFIGLVVPNIVSRREGDGSTRVLLDTGIVGAVLLLVCDLISRLLIYPYELPVSLVLGIVGATLFIVFILRGHYEK